MRIAVSACLLGENCKYNGGNNYHAKVAAFVQGHEVVPLCPERRSGMPSPRPRVEIRAGRLVDEFGTDVDALYRQGVADSIADMGYVDMAILQPRSPTCGAHQVYDGSFSGRLLPGQGALAAALIALGIPIYEPEELDALGKE